MKLLLARVKAHAYQHASKTSVLSVVSCYANERTESVVLSRAPNEGLYSSQAERVLRNRIRTVSRSYVLRKAHGTLLVVVPRGVLTTFRAKVLVPLLRRNLGNYAFHAGVDPVFVLQFLIN
jgi:hypothetical protein